MRILLALLCSVTFLTCGDDAGQKTGEADALTYVLISFSEIDSIPDAKITIIIKDLAFSGEGPVNRYFGKIADGRISSPIGSTMMAGPENLMQIEQLYYAALDSAFISGVGRDSLRITSPNGAQLVFVLTKN
jgi:heat shock protein HslJ